MNQKPIGPELHCAIDYGFVAIQLLGPSVFNLKGSARTLSYAFGGAQLVLNALTDQPLAVKRVVPFRVHGQAETFNLPMLLLLPWVTGALRKRRARAFFFGFFALALTNYLLTDYNANEPQRTSGRSQRMSRLAGRVRPATAWLRAGRCSTTAAIAEAE